MGSTQNYIHINRVNICPLLLPDSHKFLTITLLQEVQNINLQTTYGLLLASRSNLQNAFSIITEMVAIVTNALQYVEYIFAAV